MKTIYKYQLILSDEQTVNMPIGSNILSVQFQANTLCLWAEVYTTRPTEKYIIHVFGTGEPLPDYPYKLTFLGTVQKGPFVWHVFLKDDQTG